ncbi:MAG: AAA family ATPase [Eubacteriales bacterium]|nr:AAA family ATPase [Eubacteriales bacterium]
MKLKHKNTVIIVTGGPGTGKSYAAARIHSNIEDLDVLSYDKIKEKEWDRFGFDNKEQKDRLNWFSLEEFYLSLQKMMWEGKTILIEYPFYQRHRDQLAQLTAQYDYRVITLLLYGDWKTIYERGLTRDTDSGRHPGHLTNTYHIERGLSPEDIIPDAVLTYEQFRADIDRKNYDIQLGVTIPVDVTDFSKVNFDDIFAEIEKADSI